MTSTSKRVLLRGGRVYSPATPQATAMLTVGDKVAWIGDDGGAASHAPSADVVVELDGALVTPGFVDAHVHLGPTGFALQSLDLSSTVSLADALEQLERFACSHSGRVLYAYGWDETKWSEGRPMTMAEVDRAVGRAVAYISRVDSHSSVVSSALLDRDPSIAQRDGWHGDGVVERDAHHAVRTITHGLWTTADREQALRAALTHAASRGLTCVHEVNAPHIAPYADFAALRAIADTTTVSEVVPYWGAFRGGDADLTGDGLLGFAGDLCVDGAVGSRTACMHEAYADADTSGHLYLNREQVAEHVVYCTERDLQAGFHVIGDRAMTETMAGFEAAVQLVGVAALVRARHRLEHAEMPTPEAVQAMARLGVVASVQPAFDAEWGAAAALYEQRLGAERARPMNPFGSMRRAGIVLAFGSDSPVTPLDPWAGVRAAVFHHAEHERLTPTAAFDAHTRGGHRARRDDAAGVLKPGAAATYAVWRVDDELPRPQVVEWSSDPGADVPSLPDLHPDKKLPVCLTTVVAGATAYDAQQLGTGNGSR
ncbi:MAG: amidohydrolase [Nocardioidaceae bacterium]